MARWVVLLWNILLSFTGVTGSIYQPLFDYVTSQSHPFAIPQPDPSTPLQMDVRIGVTDIEEVNDVTNTVCLRSWHAARWNSSVVWDPANFHGIESIALPLGRVYSPYITTLEAGGNYQVLEPPKVVHNSDGWTRTIVFSRWCLMCDLSSGDDSCVIRLHVRDADNKVITIRDPNTVSMNLNKLMAPFRFQDGRYQLISESYTKKTITFAEFPWVFYDKIDYRFSFREVRNRRLDSRALFSWE